MEILYLFESPSDVTTRPKGTITFKSDDGVDLENKILKVLENKQEFEYQLWTESFRFVL